MLRKPDHRNEKADVTGLHHAVVHHLARIVASRMCVASLGVTVMT